VTGPPLVKLAPAERSKVCDQCGAPADAPMYRGAICDPCLDELAERVAGRQALRGYGGRVEPTVVEPEIRERFPAQYVMLRCTSASCNSTWYGPRNERCSACATALEGMQRHQAELVLQPELPDPADVRYGGAVRAWGERLARAVEAGLITEHEALSAWRRVVRSERAA